MLIWDRTALACVIPNSEMFALQKAIHAMEESNQIVQVSAIKRGSTTICVPQFRKVESETEPVPKIIG